MSGAAEFGQWGGDNEERPFVTLEGVDYPLVPESIVEGAPLNPFSPSNADGNTVAVISQRHASEVWDDLTGGVGYRDDEPGSHQYAVGNLDTRVPAAWTVPPLLGEVGTGVAGALPYTSADVPVVAHLIQNDAGATDFICYQKQSPTSGTTKVRGIQGNVVRTVAVPDTDRALGFAEWNGAWWLLTTNGTDTKLWNMVTVGGAFTLVNTAAFTTYYGLVMMDNKLLTMQVGGGAFTGVYQWGGTAWVSYVGGFNALAGNESFRQLFVWTDKSGARDALYCLTSRRIMVYDEEGQQWEELYRFSDVILAPRSMAHVNRRDNSLVVALLPDLTVAGATPNGTILLFTPGTVDNIPINKSYGYPADQTYGAGGLPSTSVAAPIILSSGIHWLYAFCYAPGTAPALGFSGGVFAYNEFGGWTQIFDPYVFGSTRRLIGGGYGAGKLLTILDNGSYYITNLRDVQQDHPSGNYDSQAVGSAHIYFVRSGRVYNKQRNIKKLGSHIEVTFRNPLPSSGGLGTVFLRYRYFNENGLSGWGQSSFFPDGAQRVSVDLHDNVASNGIQYYYMEWELDVYMSTLSATPPIVESVVLYYTYFQTNRYAYSFNIDLTAETWKEYFPDGTFHGNTREYLQTQLLAMMDQTNYHSFSYSQWFWTETVTRADCSLARRESSDDASGIYSMTVRDLEADQTAGTTNAKFAGI